LFKKGDTNETGEHIQKALRLGTQEPRFFFHAGMINAKQGRSREALNYLTRALDLNPRHASAMCI
jgi:Flp pilus assembly protein TadD